MSVRGVKPVKHGKTAIIWQVVIFDINAGSMPSCVISKIPDAAAGYTVSDALWPPGWADVAHGQGVVLGSSNRSHDAED